MLCEKCQNDIAKVYCKKTVKNKTFEYFLCRECANIEKGGCFLTNITNLLEEENQAITPSDELISFTSCQPCHK